MTTSHRTAEEEIIFQDPTHAEPLGHGNSPAAWTLVLMILAGSLLVGVGMLADLIVLIIAGAVVAVAGLVAGFVMSKAGMGAEAHAARSQH